MKNVCKNCGGKEVYVKKRCLCKSCYEKERYCKEDFESRISGTKFKSFIERRNTLIENLFEKKGVEIFGDLADLNSTRFSTFQEVANKYNVTRERVRQWYEMIFRTKRRDFSKDLKENVFSDKTSCRNDPRNKVAEYMEGWQRKGAITELRFHEECNKRGLVISPCKNNKIDSEVNGYLVEIKGTYSEPKILGRATTRRFRYSCSKIQAETSDFIACYHPIKDSFFIIPSFYIMRLTPNHKTGIRIFYISENIIKLRHAKNPYWEFENAWDLLERKQVAA
jgi:hypothetical protein